jgi:glycosyltransferase involved in cell wall biosynthesis
VFAGGAARKNVSIRLMKMRLLVIGHSYVTPFAQAKYVAMKALRPDLALRLVVPPIWRHLFGSWRAELADGLRPEELVIIRSFGGSTNMSYLLDPLALAALMRQFDPTHIHIEEDPHSAVGAEAVWLSNRICGKAALSFFTWDNLNRTPAFPLGIVKRRLTRFGFSRSRLVICGNEEARGLLASRGYSGASEVIPQVGLSVPTAPTDRVSDTKEWIPTIGYFGRLVEEKGILDLLEALNHVRDLPWRLVIHGEGPLRHELEEKWQPLFGARMECLDPVPHNEVAGRLATLDAFVLPSYSVPSWKEQFGLTLAQAMLAGCACIGSSSGAIPDVLGGAGLVFPERDVPALAGLLRHVLSSPVECARLGSAATAYALSHYANQAIAARYLHAFEAVSN